MFQTPLNLIAAEMKMVLSLPFGVNDVIGRDRQAGKIMIK